MNFKDHPEVYVLNAPVEFEPEMEAMKAFTSIKKETPQSKPISFIIAFVQTQDEVNTAANTVNHFIEGDAVVWFAYPKGTSKKYRSAINRDKGWEILGGFGFEPVRAVAIDENWSGLRFRKAGYIKTMKRDQAYAMSKEGKEKASRK